MRCKSKKKRKTTKTYTDAAHDAKRNLNIPDELEIGPAINIRKNAVAKASGSHLRKKEVLLMNKLGREGRKQKRFGNRWIAEIVFSALKRVLGDSRVLKALLHKRPRHH